LLIGVLIDDWVGDCDWNADCGSAFTNRQSSIPNAIRNPQSAIRIVDSC